MWARTKRLLTWLSIGAFFGFVGWSLFGRGMTSLMFGSLGGSFTCRADVRTALDQFVSMQLYSALGGALAALTLLLLLARRHARRSRAAASQAEPLPGAPS